jgi:hypothetical protein
MKEQRTQLWPGSYMRTTRCFKELMLKSLKNVINVCISNSSALSRKLEGQEARSSAAQK